MPARVMVILSVQISVVLKVSKEWGLHPFNKVAALAEALGSLHGVKWRDA